MLINKNNAIISLADRTVRRTGSRDADRNAEELGITIYEAPFKKQMGAYTVIERNRCIFFKEDLPETMRSIVLLHEIGHDRLHRKQARHFQEFNLFDMHGSRMEYEANLFAAQIMLPDEEIVEYIHQGCSADQIASLMGSTLMPVTVNDRSQ